MAGIILKDGVGNEIEYSGVSQIKIPYKNSDGTTKGIKYTDISSLKIYAVTQSDGKYLVQKRFEYIPSNDCYVFAVYETECREFDDDDGSTSDKGCAVLVFVTPKTLTIGETYALADMY